MIIQVVGVISLLGMLHMCAMSVGQVRQLWRNEPVRIDNYRQTTVFGRAVFRAFRRSLPVILVLAFPLLITALVLVLAGGPVTTIGLVARAMFVVICFMLVSVALSVFLFNRPRILIPPHLRDAPGFINDVTQER